MEDEEREGMEKEDRGKMFQEGASLRLAPALAIYIVECEICQVLFQ